MDSDEIPLSQRIYIASRDKRAIAVDIKQQNGRWYYKPILPHHSYKWMCANESYFHNAVMQAESFVISELDSFNMSKLNLEKQLIDGLALLSPAMLLKIKKAIDDRVGEILRVRVAVLMGEHNLTAAERNYVAVLLTQHDAEASSQNKDRAVKSHTKLITNKSVRNSDKTLRPEKCKAVVEQIVTIRREIRDGIDKS